MILQVGTGEGDRYRVCFQLAHNILWWGCGQKAYLDINSVLRGGLWREGAIDVLGSLATMIGAIRAWRRDAISLWAYLG